jgi:hypothetical protein
VTAIIRRHLSLILHYQFACCRCSDWELDVWDGFQARHMFCFTNIVGSSKEISREKRMQFQENWPTYVLCYRYACSLKLVLLIYISL